MGSKLKLDVVGMEDLMNEFEKMSGPELKKLEREAVRAGAKPVKKAQEKLWNKSVQKKKKKNHEHIVDNIVEGKPFDTPEGTGLNVGPKMDLRWRGKFVEYGTSYQAPQAPIDKSRQVSNEAATQEMMKVLGRVVK